MLLILPDTPRGEAVALAAAVRADCQVICHASGRPWLLGDWAEGELRLFSAGRRRLAVVGPARVDGRAAEKALGRVAVTAHVDALARRMAGSFHLVTSIDGRVTARGSVSTARQLFHARVGGVTVAADSPALLCAATGATVDVDTLALHLLAPGPPWPLSMRGVWRGIAELDVGCRLDLTADGTARSVRWWRPPAGELPLHRAAPALRTALLDAVSAHVRGRRRVSADLSGGLDSTSLCFLADAVGVDLRTFHWEPPAPGDDDTVWARRAARLLPRARHLSVPADRAPDWFTGAARDEAEGPVLWNGARGQLAVVSRMAADDGAGVHLTAIGGDELFTALPVVLWSLIRHHPLRALPVVRRGHRPVGRVPLPTVRELADTRSFPAWLDGCTVGLAAPPTRPYGISAGWGAEVRMPPWATADALATVHRALRAAAAEDPAPLDPDRARHQILEMAVAKGRALRQLRAAHARYGVAWEAPFLDDRVLEAALSLRLCDRVVRGRHEPLLAAAMRGIVPDPMLARRPRGGFGAEAGRGFGRVRHDLVARCDDLRLARLGLVDADRLRAALLAPASEAGDPSLLFLLESTLACETWLRSVSVAARAPRAADPAGGAS